MNELATVRDSGKLNGAVSVLFIALVFVYEVSSLPCNALIVLLNLMAVAFVECMLKLL